MVWKARSHGRFFLRVRMKRSARPLPSGARTKAGELAMPRKAISSWTWWDLYGDPWLRGTAGVPGSPGRPRQNVAVRLPDRLQGLERGGACMRVDAEAFGRAMIAHNEYPAWPWSVIVVVRSAPHIVSSVSRMMVPS